VHKHITGKEHQIQFLASVLPSANATINRQEATYPSLFQLSGDLLFVP